MRSKLLWILAVAALAGCRTAPVQPPAEARDTQQQRGESLRQSGWQSDYGGYMAVGHEWRPARMTLQRASVRVRLIVDGWNSCRTRCITSSQPGPIAHLRGRRAG